MPYKNPEDAKTQQKRYYQNNKEKLTANQKMYRSNNKDKIAARMKIWRINNNDKIRKYMNKYIINRKKTDMRFKMVSILRARMGHTLKGRSKSARTEALLGCSVNYFLDHIESQFDDEMSWSNHGDWHLDHIIPCASFDLSDPGEQRRCFHYVNLQPLWAEDNLAKSDK